jgi:uncharacterized protein
MAFYGGLFGWEFRNAMPEESGGRYFIAQMRGGNVAAVGSLPPSAPARAIWNTYVSVDSADDTAASVLAAGGRALMGPFDVADAGRMAVFADPEGAIFSVWQPNKHIGAQIVNEPGSLNFNGLNTREPEAAKSFYTSVFGWGTLAMDGGFQLWTLPGYADHLELSDPGLRERIAGMGVAAEFADVVASINPIPSDQGDVPAHWSVTFAVDGADAVARRAGELGGTVIMPPFDAPWVRTAVIADPQGATFIVSQFAPENKDIQAPGASDRTGVIAGS